MGQQGGCAGLVRMGGTVADGRCPRQPDGHPREPGLPGRQWEADRGRRGSALPRHGGTRAGLAGRRVR
ncbi:hypothetical protein ABTL20_21870, partial [Acinetobacter baumannii]